ncbi:MinD/ParA family ATP-binding protein, partial [Actinocorallia lasiicapitis]
MALIALAADKGAPGVTTAAVALGAVWPRPVMVAECDLAGGDLVHRLPAENGMLDPSKGLLSLAASARRGLRPEQIAPHTQRLTGGLDVLVGLTNAEQAAGMTWLWNPLGRSFAILPGIDVIADCGRLGPHSALIDLMREADMVVLLTHASVDHVAHLRERIAALAADLPKQRAHLGVVVVADPRGFRGAIGEVERILAQSKLPATVLGGLAYDPKGAHLLRGPWAGRLDKSLLIRSARELAANLLQRP